MEEYERLEKLRAPLIAEFKEYLKTWTDDEVQRHQKFVMVYRCDVKMRTNVYSERCKIFHAADVDGDFILNRQEFEEYFKSIHVWQKKWGCAERECSPEWYNMYYDAINERCDDYEGCTG